MRRKLTKAQERHVARLKRLRQALSNKRIASSLGCSVRVVNDIPARGRVRELRQALGGEELEGDGHLQQPLPL